MVNYDGTVRNSIGQMVQLRYGEDGLDGMWVEDQTIPILKPTNSVFEKDFKLDLSDERQLRRLYTDGVVREVYVSDSVVPTLTGSKLPKPRANRSRSCLSKRTEAQPKLATHGSKRSNLDSFVF